MTQHLRELLTSVDILNTLHGGVSEPFLSLTENKKGREIRVRVPGVDKELVQAEIEDNEISIFYIIPVESSGQVINMPKVVYRDKLTENIEVDHISAGYSDDELVVFLPYDEMLTGRRTV